MPHVYSKTDPTQPGYFRIGFVVLQIPPTDISCNKVTNDDQVSTLRGQTPMFVKSGQSRWDVTVRWKAISFLQSNGVHDYSQWFDLQSIAAIFKAAPFVEVDNEFLRQHFTAIQPAYKTQRLAFALKQLRIDTNQDSSNVLDVTLTMSLFNYAPFSTDFGYVSTATSTSSGADQSDVFQNFIAQWIASNFSTKPASLSSPPIQSWQNQAADTIAFKWRTYVYIPFKTTQAAPVSNASAGYAPLVPPPTVPPGVSSVKISNSIQTIVNTAAAAANPPVDPAIASALCFAESGGNPLANQGKTNVGLGLFQLLASTAAGLGVTGNSIWDPTQNANAGCQYLANQLKSFGNYPSALAAYNAGPQFVKAYLTGNKALTYYDPTTGTYQPCNPNGIITPFGIPPDGIPHGETPTTYVNKILASAGKSNLLTNTSNQPTPTNPPPSTANQPTATQSLDTPDPDLVAAANNAISQINNQVLGQSYIDHFTEFGSLHYQENMISLAGVDSPNPSEYSMFTNQISIVMANNLPVIPLAAFQYPTFQHVGPCDTMISISFNSVGSQYTELHEPEHFGIEALAAMASQLEDQFHNLRTVARKVSSIHRMQAVFVENKLLNLLGIQGVMVRGLNTETVPEAVGLAQVSLMVSQYDNVFEETTPYSMNGISAAYSAALKNMMTGGQLSNLTPEEQNAYSQVTAFSAAWTALDPNFLIQQIFALSKNPINFLTGLANNTPSLSLTGSQKNDILNALDQDINPGGVSDEQALSSAGMTIQYNQSGQTQATEYPGLQLRRLAVQPSSTQLSYADFFVFSQLPLLVNQAEITTLNQQLKSQYAAQMPTILGNMYSHLWDVLLQINPLLASQAISLTNSPGFRSQFAGALKVDGPSSLPANAGHFCYQDLGLTAYNQTPTSYMVNYNDSISNQVSGLIQATLGTANQTSNQVNAVQGVQGSAAAATPGTNEFTANAQQIMQIGAGSALSRMFNLPAYSMDTAYPTFKLFLIEESNTGVFFAFDNFQSYASVMDIEIIKYQDKPDTAIVQITNLAHLLQHRMYDDTAAGKMEAEADKFNLSSGLASDNTPTTGGNPNAGFTAGKSITQAPYEKARRINMTEGMGETYSKIPLKFFSLQTGSKIQIRMGFSNNPDALYPVFTGQVTSIEGDDILTLTCQSFMLELMNTPGTLVKEDSYLGLNAVSGGAAFGGYQLMDSGDTVNIMKTMLTSPQSRHFGHWQVGAQETDPLLKGFMWLPAAGQVLASSSNQTIAKIGSLLQTAYDRSGENILVNFTINYDSTSTATYNGLPYNRSWYNENPNWFLGSAVYSIPKQSKMSIWEILKDVSRRYPNYNLMVRSYGFPYECDATLVYADPLDWYYSRPLLYGDAETEAPNNVTQGDLFAKWWSSTGAEQWGNIFDQAININPSLSGLVTAATQTSLKTAMATLEGPATTQAGSGPEGFAAATETMHQFLTGQVTGEGFGGTLYNFSILVTTAGNIGGGFSTILDNDFTALAREWQVYLQNAEPAANSGRIKPVRAYHLIDQNHIVHNGITVNDNIYNAVKIGDYAPYKFNQNIPDQHLRVLDVTEMINNPDINVYNDVINLTGGTPTYPNAGSGLSAHPIANAYAQSFLREEVGKMYKGDLVLRGVPEIEPFDVILLSDPSTGMVGPIEVDSVIHSFNVQDGYITIVRPKLLLLARESASFGLIQNLAANWATAGATIQNLENVFDPSNPKTTISAMATEVGVGTAALFTAAVGFAWAPPVGITLAMLGLLAGAGLLFYTEQRNTTTNFFQMMPLSRFGRPWVGGLQGFAIGDFAYSLQQKFRWFDAQEIQPLIESWQTFMNYNYDYVNNTTP